MQEQTAVEQAAHTPERLDALEAVAEAAKALCAFAVESEWSDADQTGMGFLRAALAKLEEAGK